MNAGRHIMSYRQLRVMDLPKVITWRLEVESNKRPSAPKAQTPPLNQPRPYSPSISSGFKILQRQREFITRCWFLNLLPELLHFDTLFIRVIILHGLRLFVIDRIGFRGNFYGGRAYILERT